MTAPTGTQTDTAKTTTDANASGAGSDKADAKVDGTATGTGADTSTKKDDDASGLKSALQKERKRADEAERALREKSLAELPELERFKSEAERLTKENEKLQVENQRMKIGMELGLKWNVAKRISGDTEAEMREDAAELLRSMRNEDDDKSSTKSKDKDAVNKAKTNDGKATGPAGKADMNTLFRAAAGRRAV